MFYRGMILHGATNIIVHYVDPLYADGIKLIFNGYYSNLSSIQSVFFREDTHFIHIYFSHNDIRYHLKFFKPISLFVGGSDRDKVILLGLLL